MYKRARLARVCIRVRVHVRVQCTSTSLHEDEHMCNMSMHRSCSCICNVYACIRDTQAVRGTAEAHVCPTAASVHLARRTVAQVSGRPVPRGFTRLIVPRRAETRSITSCGIMTRLGILREDLNRLAPWHRIACHRVALHSA